MHADCLQILQSTKSSNDQKLAAARLAAVIHSESSDTNRVTETVLQHAFITPSADSSKQLIALDGLYDLSMRGGGTKALLHVMHSKELSRDIRSKLFEVLLSLAKHKPTLRTEVFQELEQVPLTVEHLVLLGEIAKVSPTASRPYRFTLQSFLENSNSRNYYGQDRGLGSLCPFLTKELLGDSSTRLLTALISWNYFKHEYIGEPFPGMDSNWEPDTEGAVDLDMAKALRAVANCDPESSADLLKSHSIQVLNDLVEGVLNHEKIHESTSDEYPDSTQNSFVTLGEYLCVVAEGLGQKEQNMLANECDRHRKSIVSDSQIATEAKKELWETAKRLRSQ